jgi:hypothetical protein
MHIDIKALMHIDIIVPKIVLLRQIRWIGPGPLGVIRMHGVAHSDARLTHCFELEVSYDRRRHKREISEEVMMCPSC